MRKKLFIISVISILLLLVIWLSITSSLTSGITEKIYMFSDINECNGFKDIEKERYVNALKDNNLSDLKYKKFYGAYCENQDFEFEIFAYEFENVDFAKQYYRNYINADTDRNTIYHLSSGHFLVTLLVIDENKAYIINTNVFDVKDVQSFISHKFSLDITEKMFAQH